MQQSTIVAAMLGCLVAGAAYAQDISIGMRTSPAVDPHYLWLSTNTAYNRHIFETLIDKTPDNTLIPQLALSWTPDGDSAWVFRLRPGVKFHDGTPFSAEDVLASLKRVPNVLNNPGSYNYTIQSIKSAEMVDPLTIRFHTDGPKPYLPGEITHFFIVPRQIAETAATADFRSGKAAIGTGPFRFQEYVPDSRFAVVRNDGYWAEKPVWQKVTFRIIHQDASRVAALLSGDVNAIEYVPPADVATLRANPAVKVVAKATPRFLYLKFDVEPGPRSDVTDKAGNPLPTNALHDVRVRRAISLGIDCKSIAEQVMSGFAVPAEELTPKGFNGYDPSIQPTPYDPQQARTLLAQAGYPDGFGLTIACSNDRFVNNGQICQAIAQNLARIGLAMKVETLPSTVFFGKIKPPVPQYSFFMAGWGSSMTGEADALWTMARTYDPAKNTGQSNVGGYSNPELDRIVDMARGTLDHDKRGLLLQQAMRIVMDDAAVLPLHYQSIILGARQGFTVEARTDEETRAMDMRPAN
jgi:peptide/nickel transport system substrate-binding protein